VLGQLRQSRRTRCVQMVQNAGLVFGDRFPSFVLAHMLAMAGEKDGWIGIQETSDSRVEHTRDGVTNGLICQTNMPILRGSPMDLQDRHCHRRVYTSAGKAQQELQPDRYSCCGRRPHPEEFRTDAAPGRRLKTDPDHR
jgi:hypothetical protein